MLSWVRSISLAQGLAALKNGDGSIIYQLSFSQGSEAALDIACGDGAKVTDDAAKLQKYTNSIDKVSSISSIVAGIRVLCS